MPEFIRSLSDLTTGDSVQVGSKAAVLGELYRRGIRVPPGFVLINSAYLDFIGPLSERILQRLSDDVIMDPSEIESAASEIRKLIEEQPYSNRLTVEIQNALAALGDVKSFAVRTSPPGDDLATAFGSGVERAYLGVVGADEVAAACARCWASLWNSRAMYYRHRKKIPQTGVALAILIQPMVPAESAGVMYTSAPGQAASNEIQIQAIRGLGAPLTGARIKPNQIRLDRVSGQVLEWVVEEQIVKLVVGADGHTEEQGISLELANTPALTQSQAHDLGATGKAIQDHLNFPQDIEWAVARDEIFILQARPMGIRNA